MTHDGQLAKLATRDHTGYTLQQYKAPYIVFMVSASAMKVIFVPISVVGCGKSTVFRALQSVFPHFRYLENDSCSSKGEFYSKVNEALDDESVEAVLLDRNNHLVQHRKEIVTKFHREGVVLVALLFVPLSATFSDLYDRSWDRITGRGDNHPQIKAESNKGQSKMILNSFAKSFRNFDKKAPFDRDFDYVVELSSGQESSKANIATIVKQYEQICQDHAIHRTMPSAEALSQALDQSLLYRV